MANNHEENENINQGNRDLKKSKSYHPSTKVLGALAVSAAVVITGVGLVNFIPNDFNIFNSPAHSIEGADPDKIHAVFIEGGQVYFGNIVNSKQEELVLEDAYFLQLGNIASTEDNPTEGDSNVQDITINKRSQTIHKPTGTMIFNRNKVIFIEQLEDDSPVLDAIAEINQN